MKNTLTRVGPLHCLITRTALAAAALAPALVPGCCIAARWAA